MTKRITRWMGMIGGIVAMFLALGAPAQAEGDGQSTAAVAATAADIQPQTVQECRDYIDDMGYTVGPLVIGACNIGKTDWDRCYDRFINQTDVWASHARAACTLAGIT